MKVRVVMTLDVDEERLKERYPLTVEREGGVREAARAYAVGAVEASEAARNGSVRSVTPAR
ncbi:hypothetical protein [Streptomyces scabiei]|uniref:hypothetical protein n=1 Tax=Streptomyces scabiei TaxID=1930 RepID=UPI0029BEEDE3|nr:hypothetical protein [Streptomyces scabiei]MDX2794055.1 hypothetical protein [Streptomyces scabiei]